MAKLEDLSRQRLDFRDNADGSVTAMLTVTLGDGTVHRYEQSADEDEVNRRAKAIANAEMRELQISGAIAGMSEEEIAGIFGKIYNAAKKVVNGARKIASSKVFKYASGALIALGPVFPPAAAVGAGMLAASELSDASYAYEADAENLAKKIANGVKKWSGMASASKGKRGAAKQVVEYGNKRRLGAARRLGFSGRFARYAAARMRANEQRARRAARRSAPPARPRTRRRKASYYARKREILARRRQAASRPMPGASRPSAPRTDPAGRRFFMRRIYY